MSQQALPRGLALCFPAASPGLCLRAALPFFICIRGKYQEQNMTKQSGT